MREVLKLKPGDTLRVGIVNGLPATATVVEVPGAGKKKDGEDARAEVFVRKTSI